MLAQIGALPIEVDRHLVPRSERLVLSLRFGLSAAADAPGVGCVASRCAGQASRRQSRLTRKEVEA